MADPRLDEVARTYGYPKYLRIDNGTEVTSKIMQLWSEENCVELLFIQPGKPTQSAFIESFNSRVRAEFLNAHWFRSLLEARNAADEWRNRYHTTHSHSSLGYMTPEEFLWTYEIKPEISSSRWPNIGYTVIGMHDIHMMQGNSGQFASDNRINGDGALFIRYSGGETVALFTRFDTQSVQTSTDGNSA